jgi:glycosyltransferase involved in cell wall biosynthesis
MSIAIYTIMRDEVENVAQWAETTGDADFRLVIDTGSTDGTVDELVGHGIRVARASIEPFRFDDARNMALALLPDEIDWCLQLDADETLNDTWRASFDDVVDERIPRYRYRWENHGLASWGVVMRTNLHARHGFRWRYPCHEVLTPNTLTIDVPLMVVEHHPDERKSRAFYLDLLAHAAADEPSDHRMAFYYGRELIYRGLWDKARVELMRFLELPGGWAPERSEAYRLLASVDSDPERWLWRSVAECPERREPFCDLARFHLNAGRGAVARAMMQLAATRDEEGIYTTQADCWGEGFALLVDECAVMP